MMKFLRWTFALLVALLSALPAAHGQAFTQIVILGDSLTDTGNDTAASTATNTAAAAVPAPVSGYTTGRFTDGIDSAPMAQKYFGVWAEQLAKMFPTPPTITNSLAGGTNYAYGYAFTGSGTTAFTYGPGLSFTVQNMGSQLNAYLGTHPTITNKTLFIVWGGANDILNATSTADISTAVTNEAGIVQQLIAAGATNILVPNLPPLGLVPRLNTTGATATAATQAAAGFNQGLATALAQITTAAPSVHLYQLDVYTLFNTIVALPNAKGIFNVTAMSQGNTTINPDQYLFWDGLHPTTTGHNILAAAALTLLNGPIATTTVAGSFTPTAKIGSNIQLTATVTAASGSATPMGTVTFRDGSTVLGTGLVTGTNVGAQGVATFTTTTLSAGPHNITASFAGVNGFSNSTSANFVETIVTASLTIGFNPSSINIPLGSTGTATLVFTPAGGFSSTATVACGSVPAHLSCTTSASSLSFPGDDKQQTVTFTFNTNAAAMRMPTRPGVPSRPQVFFGLTLLGFLGLGTLHRERKKVQRVALTLLLTFAGAGLSLGLMGCVHISTAGATLPLTKGSYVVTSSVSVNGVASSQNLVVMIQ
jgi:phospholipase/lecithinase/hemolysin